MIVCEGHAKSMKIFCCHMGINCAMWSWKQIGKFSEFLESTCGIMYRAMMKLAGFRRYMDDVGTLPFLMAFAGRKG